MGSEVRIKGLERLVDALREAPETVAREVRLAMKKSLRDIQEEARGNHEFTTRLGVLEKAVETEIRDTPELEGRVYLNQDLAPYAKYVHEGTGEPAGHQAWTIYPRNKKTLRWPGTNGFVFSSKAIHTGTEPDPFLREAADRKEMGVRRYFRKALENVTKKLGGK